MNRSMTVGPIVLDLGDGDEIEFGWNPEAEAVRLITRGPEHIARRRGSLVSIHMGLDQLKALLLKGAALVDMVEGNRVPGDRPMRLECPHGKPNGFGCADCVGVPDKTWKGEA